MILMLIRPQAPSLDTHDAEVYSELALAFASDGRVSNVTRIMAMHPQFLTVCV
jgi:hypothetical protein